MKREFKVGDRVRVYSHYGPYDGTVVEVDRNVQSPYRTVGGMLLIQSDETGQCWNQHPRQCVRLVKKPRMERWFVVDTRGVTCSDQASEEVAKRYLADLDWRYPEDAPHRVVHMREVRKK